ncbi:hypothetical protein KVT40_008374 [Elsinoe batatas]|uniref:NYN domain-containing protein n=1 Tax=Elsinoe batatas TaxID=2601811 RepID=A0A8K0PDS4_9PEZI|nr:hypothetical protein KVT40_008374 [Elsinoe batatas]
MNQSITRQNHYHMVSVASDKPWDFTAVYSLLNTLSEDNTPHKALTPIKRNNDSQDKEPSKEDTKQNTINNTTTKSDPASGLGDFSQLWQFLDTPPPTRKSDHLSPNTSPTLHHRIPAKIEYTSDGAAYNYPASAKKLQWRDEVNDGTLTDVAPAMSDGEPSKLSKKQRKKLNRRKRMEEAEDARRAVSDMESEAEMPTTPRNPAAKASIHTVPTAGVHKYKLRARDENGRAITPQSSPVQQKKTPKKQDGVVAVPFSETTNIPHNDESKVKEDALRVQVAEAGRKVLARYNSEPPESQPVPSGEKVVKKEWPVSKPYDAKALSMLPAFVRPNRSLAPRTNKSTVEATSQSSSPPKQPEMAVATWTTPSKPSSRFSIQPITIRPPEDRHWALLLKLINHFWEDKRYLVAPANLSNHSSSPTGIHVFIDASNILIGFRDALKRARGIPPHVRVPRVDISFDSLALLLERRRPIAKRVLAGSTPHIPAFDIAKSIGYECCILDKVYKARELTDRQRYFMSQDAKASLRRSQRRKSNATPGGDSEGYASAASTSSTDAPNTLAAIPTHAPEKFVEQGVDEILHLKILESIIDADEPTTIVLATGDAAQAEYSGGFMKMVERALEKGWRVELVSWKAGVSQLYLKRGFRERWGERFRVVELDGWVEEMLEM